QRLRLTDPGFAEHQPLFHRRRAEEREPRERARPDRIDVRLVEHDLVIETRIVAQLANLLGVIDPPIEAAVVGPDGRQAVWRREMHAGHTREPQRYVRYLRKGLRPVR